MGFRQINSLRMLLLRNFFTTIANHLFINGLITFPFHIPHFKIIKFL